MRRDDDAGLQLLDAGDDDNIPVCQARRHCPVRAGPDIELDAADGRPVALAEHEDIVALAILLHGRGRHDRKLGCLSLPHGHGDILAGHQLQFGIWKLGINSDGAGGGIDLVVDEGDLAGQGIGGAIR